LLYPQNQLLCQFILDGYNGNPTDLRAGCQLSGVVQHECGNEKDCPGSNICQPDINGIRKCFDPCSSIVCPDDNEMCIAQNGRPQCRCHGKLF